MVKETKGTLIVQNIRNLLEDTNTKQRELAFECGLSEQLLSSKMRCHSNFTLRDVCAIAKFFDVSVDFLLAEHNKTE